MTLRCALACAAAALLAACSVSPPAGTLSAALDGQLAENAERHGIAGQAVLILRNGKTIYRGSQGLADREARTPVRPGDIFAVFSVSKLFASVLVMQLVESGKLDLRAPASRYLPDLPAGWRSITVEQFLDHVSGVPDYFDGNPDSIRPATRQAMFAELAGKPMQFETGTRTRYNQTNFIVLGAILETLYGMSYRQIVTERIVEPLGLKNTYLGKRHVPAGKLMKVYRDEDGELVPDSIIDWPEYAIVHVDLFTTIDDLGAFLGAVCQGRLVKRETLLRLWKPYRYRDGSDGSFAAGWEYGTSGASRQVGHGGGNKVAVRLVFRDSLADDSYAYVYLTNGGVEDIGSSTLIDSLRNVVSRYDHRPAGSSM